MTRSPSNPRGYLRTWIWCLNFSRSASLTWGALSPAYWIIEAFAGKFMRAIKSSSLILTKGTNWFQQMTLVNPAFSSILMRFSLSFRWKLVLTFGYLTPNYASIGGIRVKKLDLSFSPQTVNPATPPDLRTLQDSLSILTGSVVICKQRFAIKQSNWPSL